MNHASTLPAPRTFENLSGGSQLAELFEADRESLLVRLFDRVMRGLLWCFLVLIEKQENPGEAEGDDS